MTVIVILMLRKVLGRDRECFKKSIEYRDREITVLVLNTVIVIFSQNHGTGTQIIAIVIDFTDYSYYQNTYLNQEIHFKDQCSYYYAKYDKNVSFS